MHVNGGDTEGGIAKRGRKGGSLLGPTEGPVLQWLQKIRFTKVVPSSEH